MGGRRRWKRLEATAGRKTTNPHTTFVLRKGEKEGRHRYCMLRGSCVRTYRSRRPSLLTVERVPLRNGGRAAVAPPDPRHTGRVENACLAKRQPARFTTCAGGRMRRDESLHHASQISHRIIASRIPHPSPSLPPTKRRL